MSTCFGPSGVGALYEDHSLILSRLGILGTAQSDAAAFEGWALALLLHCGVKSVQIGVDLGAAP
jgi:hypothetical protein